MRFQSNHNNFETNKRGTCKLDLLNTTICTSTACLFNVVEVEIFGTKNKPK